MDYLLEQAKWYFNRKLYVYPFFSGQRPPKWRNMWNGHTQTLNEIIKYYWDSAGGIYTVVGKKGIRVLSVRLKCKKYRKYYINRILDLLGLPRDYEWIVYSNPYTAIVIESPDDRIGDQNIMDEGFRFYWQDYFLLPSHNTYYHFKKDKYPEQRPAHIASEVLFSCIDTIRKEVGDHINYINKIYEPDRVFIEKIKKTIKNFLKYIFSLVVLLLIIYLSFKSCEGCIRHYNIDHVHYHKFK